MIKLRHGPLATYKVGQIVDRSTREHDRSNGLVWVYALLTNEGNSYYVGVTVNPRARLAAHRVGEGNEDAFRLMSDGTEPRMCLLAAYGSREEAEDRERRLIRAHPHLVNRDGALELRRAPPMSEGYSRLPQYNQCRPYPGANKHLHGAEWAKHLPGKTTLQ